jgi:hypothetical protein
MTTALDAPSDALDAGERRFVGFVRDHGWACTRVIEDEEGPGFVYSTGFWGMLGLPEVVIFALNPDTAQAVLWDLFRELRDGREPIRPGRRYDDVFANIPAWFETVDPAHYRAYLGWSGWFYCGWDFPCLQLVWPDPAGVFPWQTGMRPDYDGLQPDLSPAGWGKPMA